MSFAPAFMEAYRQSLELFASFVFDKPPPPLEEVPSLLLDEQCAFFKRFQAIRHEELRRIVRDGCLDGHRRVISLSAQTWNDEGKPTIDKLSARSYATAMVACGVSPTGRITLVYLKIGMLLAFNMYRLSVFAARQENQTRILLSSVQVKRAIADAGSDRELLFRYYEEWNERFDREAHEAKLKDIHIAMMEAAHQAAIAAAVTSANLAHEPWIPECKELLVEASRNKVGERAILYNAPLLVRYRTTVIPRIIVHAFEKIPRSQDDSTPADVSRISVLESAAASTATPAVSFLSLLTQIPLVAAAKKKGRAPQLSCLMCCSVCEAFALKLNGLSDAGRVCEAPLPVHKQVFHSTSHLCGACAVPLCDVARHTFGGKTCFEAFHDGRQIVHPLGWQASSMRDDETSGVIPYSAALTLSTMKNRSLKRDASAMQEQIEAARKRLSFGGQDDEDGV